MQLGTPILNDKRPLKTMLTTTNIKGIKICLWKPRKCIKM